MITVITVHLSPEHRERLGRAVRDERIAWAREQPAPKPSWLVPWEGLSEPDREVDRRIGARLFLMGREATQDKIAEALDCEHAGTDEPCGACIACHKVMIEDVLRRRDEALARAEAAEREAGRLAMEHAQLGDAVVALTERAETAERERDEHARRAGEAANDSDRRYRLYVKAIQDRDALAEMVRTSLHASADALDAAQARERIRALEAALRNLVAKPPNRSKSEVPANDGNGTLEDEIRRALAAQPATAGESKT